MNSVTADLLKIQEHDHTLPETDGCPLCEAWERIEAFAVWPDGLTPAERRQKHMKEVQERRR